MCHAGHDPDDVLVNEHFYNDIIQYGAKVGCSLVISSFVMLCIAGPCWAHVLELHRIVHPCARQQTA